MQFHSDVVIAGIDAFMNDLLLAVNNRLLLTVDNPGWDRITFPHVLFSMFDWKSVCFEDTKNI